MFEQINETTFREVTTVTHGNTRQTIIGDQDISTKFNPLIEIIPWNEDNFKIQFADSMIVGATVNVTDKSKLLWTGNNKQFAISPIMEKLHSRFSGLVAENGGAGVKGAKFTILVDSKPLPDLDGYVRYPFEMEGHKDLIFCLQRSSEDEAIWAINEFGLTQAEVNGIMAGCRRPEYVVDSLAVYHKSRGGFNQYSTGKVCHIYRPWCQDSKGNFTWGKWEVDEVKGTLTKCIPKEAFGYPGAIWWLVDGTMGNENSGASSVASEDQIRGAYNNGSGYDPGETTTVDSLKAYMSVDSGSENTKGGIWDLGDANALETGDTGDHSISGAAAWQTLAYSSKPTVTNGTAYVMGVIRDGTDANTHYDSMPAANAGFADHQGSYAIPNPLVITTNWQRYSVYTFWAAAGGLSIPIAMHHHKMQGQ